MTASRHPPKHPSTLRAHRADRGNRAARRVKRAAVTGAAAAVEAADRLHSAAIHLLRRVRREDDGAGLTAPQLSALSVIVYRGELTLGELAHAEQVRPPTITRVVAELVRRGLATRAPRRTDRRVSVVRPTASGRQLLESGRRRRIAALADELARLPAPDLARIERALDLLERLVGPRMRHDD